TDPDNATTRKDDEQSGRTVTIITEDMQRKNNDVKARTTLLLSLPDEHQIWPLFLPQRTTAMKMAILHVLPLQALPFPLDINQIDEDDMEEMDIKWSMALLRMRADKLWKRTGKKISIQGSDVAGITEYKERKVKYIEKIRTLEMYRASNLKCIKTLDKELEELKLEKDGLDGKLAGLLKASKNLDHLIKSQMSDQVKEGVGYNGVPPPAADLYLSPKKDLP
nr:hypothetical protein [Tanacetum cinerariifolium]